MIKVIIWLCHSKLPMILETQHRIRLFDGAFSGWLISLSLISHNNSKLPLQSRPNGRSTGWKLYRMLVTSGSMIKDWCLSTVKRCLMLLLFAFKQPQLDVRAIVVSNILISFLLTFAYCSRFPAGALIRSRPLLALHSSGKDELVLFAVRN